MHNAGRAPVAPSIRMRLDPRDVPAVKAARRLGLTLAAFEAVRERLHGRGFPRPDVDTGLYDLKAVEEWMDRRSGLTVGAQGPQSSAGLKTRLDAWDGGKGAS